MNRCLARRRTALLSTLGASLFALTTAAAIRGQEPAKDPGDAPVRKELEEFREKSSKTAPPDRLRIYEQGIEEVRKSGVTEKALKVGDRAPDFELPDARGKKVKLSDLIARGPVVVTWYRGGWCPYCNIALRGFHKRLPEIRAEGASLVAISPETPDNSLSTAEKDHLEFEVLSDSGNKVAHAYGVAYKIPRVIAEQSKARLAKHNGDDSGTLPLGVTYVIDREGIIRYAFVDSDYRKRAEPSDVLAALRGLNKKPPAAHSKDLAPGPSPSARGRSIHRSTPIMRLSNRPPDLDRPAGSHRGRCLRPGYRPRRDRSVWSSSSYTPRRGATCARRPRRCSGRWPSATAGSCRSPSTSITSMIRGRTCSPTRCTASGRGPITSSTPSPRTPSTGSTIRR